MLIKSARKKGSIYEKGYRIYGIGRDPKTVFTMQLLAQWIYPNLDKDEARNEMYKLIRKYNLPKIRD